MSTTLKTLRRAAPLTLMSTGLIALVGCGGALEEDDSYAYESGDPYGDSYYGAPTSGAANDPAGPVEGNFEAAGWNPFIDTAEDNLATFSIDVDTASYTIMRRSINGGALPDPASVRVEEYINFFPYDYPAPSPDALTPFAIDLEAAPSPFGDGYQLLRVGVQGMELPAEDAPATNLVFLVDVSGSMSSSDKLGLVQYSLTTLVNHLRPQDTISLVTYAGADRVVLPPTPVEARSTILAAIDDLAAGGSTNGAAGITTAYDLAEENYRDGGVNRVVLCTDGDFNVGLTGNSLVEYVAQRREAGIFLSVMGYGSGNLNDSFIEDLTNQGNGHYSYIDSRNEALRVLGDELISTLQVIAKDVKIQVELDSDTVKSYRLIGYANRVLEDHQFADDSVDAGEIGAGHTVTAFLELELHEDATPDADDLVQVRVRYKKPEGDESAEVTAVLPMSDVAADILDASPSFRFGAAVTEFGEILGDSPYSDDTLDSVHSLAAASMFSDASSYAEFLDLVRAAQNIQ